ncbi:hypothetical protein GCM10009836_32410 [Pseudonocardia ailaonensis]|uniref:FAD-binding FR-type domain-containing protein n=1 Tax=Pseudonocardia ailaonensis TaxID=367279 RepID=A0ABN2N3F3_9PSEU
MRTTERLADAAGSLLSTAAEVTGVDRSVPRFVRVVLRAPAFRKAKWVPGAKLQMLPKAGAFSPRTFTPVRWDVEAGETELIGYTHGDGPASVWFGAVEPGAVARVFGPRRSLDLPALTGPVLFLGDESSVALACALRHVTQDVRHVFEATDPAALEAVLGALGLAGDVVPKGAEVLKSVRKAVPEGPFDLVASGDAATVHALRRDVRGWERAPRKISGKAYWAQGRTGLD